MQSAKDNQLPVAHDLWQKMVSQGHGTKINTSRASRMRYREEMVSDDDGEFAHFTFSNNWDFLLDETGFSLKNTPKISKTNALKSILFLNKASRSCMSQRITSS